MKNKMVARVLTYQLGLWSYGDSKLEKWKKFKKARAVPIPGICIGIGPILAIFDGIGISKVC